LIIQRTDPSLTHSPSTKSGPKRQIPKPSLVSLHHPTTTKVNKLTSYTHDFLRSTRYQRSYRNTILAIGNVLSCGIINQYDDGEKKMEKGG
jgi:hypothetical protein